MKRYILLFFLITLAMGIYVIAKKNPMHADSNDMFLEKSPFANIGLTPFNINQFEKEKENGVLEYTLDDGTMVQAFTGSGNETYVEWREKPESFFRIYREFFLETGAVKIVAHEWHGNMFGIRKEYDQNGQLVKETDEDAPYQFSFNDIVLLLKERGIDALTPSFDEKTLVGLSIHRSTNPSPNYVVSYPSDNPQMRHIIIVDGTTGAIITEKDELIVDEL